MASFGLRLGARAIDGMIELVLLLIPWLLVPGDRWLTRWFVALCGVAAYEAIFLLAVGATPGKLICGIRAAQLDLAGAPSEQAAIRRGLTVAVLTVVPVVGWIVLLVSVAMSPLHRGVQDRLAGVLVVRRNGPDPVPSADIAGYERIENPPDLTPFGPAADLDLRRRARARRLDDAPLLVVGIVAVAASVSFPAASENLGLVLLIAALWLPLFVADETWRIARFGGAAGHRRAGLAVVDRHTGEAPKTGRSFARALVLALFLYTPLFPITIPVLAFWVKVHPLHRGPHDLAGGTVVVGHVNLRAPAGD